MLIVGKRKLSFFYKQWNLKYVGGDEKYVWEKYAETPCVEIREKERALTKKIRRRRAGEGALKKIQKGLLWFENRLLLNGF